MVLVETVAQHHNLSPTVPTRWNDDAVAVQCIWLVDEWERVGYCGLVL